MENTKPQRWINPLDSLSGKPIYRTGLKVNNSLCNEKVEFVTKTGDRTLTWYMCGPTVYDSAHLGHARTYLSFDILRRILSSYFNYLHISIYFSISPVQSIIPPNSMICRYPIAASFSEACLLLFPLRQYT